MRREWKILWLVSLASASSSLDVTLMFVAFPEIADTFRETSEAQLSWLLNGYNIVVAALLIPAGRIADRYGRRRVFLWAIAVFITGSAAVGLAPNVPTMIAARCYQAIGGSSLITSGLALVMSSLPEKRRTTAVGVWASVAGVVASLAPTLGALAIELASWRAAFFMVVPVGLVVLAARGIIPESAEDTDARLPDFVGVGLSGLGVASLVLGIVQINEWGASDPRVVGAFLAAAVLLAAFGLRTATHPAPTINLSLFRNPVFAATTVVSMFVGAVFFGVLFSLVQFLRGPWGYSTLATGFLLTPLTAASSMVGYLTGRLMDRVGHRVVMVPAAVSIAVGCSLLALFATQERDLARVWFPAAVLIGTGAGIMFPGVNSAIAHGVKAAQLGVAAGTVQTVIRIGGTLGVGIGVAVVGTSLSSFDTFFVILAVLSLLSAVASGWLSTRPTAP